MIVAHFHQSVDGVGGALLGVGVNLVHGNLAHGVNDRRCDSLRMIHPVVVACGIGALHVTRHHPGCARKMSHDPSLLILLGGKLPNRTCIKLVDVLFLPAKVRELDRGHDERSPALRNEGVFQHPLGRPHVFLIEADAEGADNVGTKVVNHACRVVVHLEGDRVTRLLGELLHEVDVGHQLGLRLKVEGMVGVRVNRQVDLGSEDTRLVGERSTNAKCLRAAREVVDTLNVDGVIGGLTRLIIISTVEGIEDDEVLFTFVRRNSRPQFGNRTVGCARSR